MGAAYVSIVSVPSHQTAQRRTHAHLRACVDDGELHCLVASERLSFVSGGLRCPLDRSVCSLHLSFSLPCRQLMRLFDTR